MRLFLSCCYPRLNPLHPICTLFFTSLVHCPVRWVVSQTSRDLNFYSNKHFKYIFTSVVLLLFFLFPHAQFQRKVWSSIRVICFLDTRGDPYIIYPTEIIWPITQSSVLVNTVVRNQWKTLWLTHKTFLQMSNRSIVKHRGLLI